MFEIYSIIVKFCVFIFYLKEGAHSLSCSFDDGLCGWKFPEGYLKSWIVYKDDSNPYIAIPYTGFLSFPLKVEMIYPNFTGSGFLSFSVCISGLGTELNMMVGKKRVLRLHSIQENKNFVMCEWHQRMIAINSSKESISIESLTMDAGRPGIVALDNLIFSEQYEIKCPPLQAPVDGFMNCTLGNQVNSTCQFKCKDVRHVIGSYSRRCLPTGMWSGLNVLCYGPRMRLRNSKINKSPQEGEVQMLVNGSWASVCRGSSKDNHISSVLCRSLAMGSKAISIEKFPNKKLNTAWVVINRCSGSEQNILDCERSDIGKHTCASSQVFNLICGNASCPANCSCTSKDFSHKVECGPPATVRLLQDLPYYTTELILRNIDLSNINSYSFDNYPLLTSLSLTNTNIKKIEAFVLKEQITLKDIIIQKNKVSNLADIRLDDLKLIKLGDLNIFLNNIPSALNRQEKTYWSYITRHIDYSTLDLQGNEIKNITKDGTRGKEFVSSLYLENNKILFIEEESFEHLFSLRRINLAGNMMLRITEMMFSNNVEKFLMGKSNNALQNIDLRNNNIHFVDENTFQSMEGLDYLDMRYNSLTNVSWKIAVKAKLTSLYLGHNLLWNSKYEILKAMQYLIFLDISFNHLAKIDKEMFKGAKRILFLSATSADITEIEDLAFQKQKSLYYLFLDGNKLTKITKQMFTGPKDIFFISLTNNPLNIIDQGAFKEMKGLETIYLINTNLHVIDIGSTFGSPRTSIVLSSTKINMGMISYKFLRSFLTSFGYTCIPHSNIEDLCIPCDQGHYKTNAYGELKCQECPPGGFYQDAIAYVGEIVHGLGCKQCPAGSYVKRENAPGKTMESCSACLEGTNLQRLAGFRACPCLDNYYRLDRFGKCAACPIGYQCKNETINLLPGFYWIWKDEENKQNYIMFSIKLQEEHKDLNNSWHTFNGSIPKAYPCPFIGSCKGGIDSKCFNGYEGPLCAICSKGYYRMFSGCNKCPTLYLFVGQCCAVAIVAGILVFAIIKDKKSNRANRRSVSDTVFSSFKIVIGFYQVTSGTLNAYSYIKWPAALTKLMTFADVVQLNIFKLVPLECLKQSIRLTPYAGLVVYISLDAMVILIAILYLFVQKAFTNINCDIKRLSKCKANCYRAVFLVIFITYPATCEKVFQVLPSSCHKVCDNEQDCSWYLQSDYSSKCFTSFYNRFVILAYFALLIPIGFPVATTFFLWKYCKNSGSDKVHLKVKKKRFQDDAAGHEISVGMRFLYENYSEDCWYWEIIELVRKVIFTSVLVYSGQEGRLFLGVTAILSGFYAVYFAHTQPIPHLFDKWLHLGALMATMANQFMAMLLKIPAETVSTLVDVESDAIGITVMLMFANLFVVIIIVVRYVYGVYFTMQAIRENPKCDLSCVLSVLQVVNFGQGHDLSTKKGKRTGREDKIELRNI